MSYRPALSRASAESVQNFDLLPDSALIDLPSLMRLACTSRPTVYRWIKAGRLPAPRKVGSQKIFWSVREIRDFLAGSAA